MALCLIFLFQIISIAHIIGCELSVILIFNIKHLKRDKSKINESDFWHDI